MMPSYLSNARASNAFHSVDSWVDEISSNAAGIAPWASATNVVHVNFGRPGRGEIAAKEPAPNAASDVSEWREVAVRRLSALNRLSDGWDGPGSIGISDGLLARAERILELAFEGRRFPAPPAAVPAGDGSVQLEWRLIDTRFEFVIETNGEMEAWAQDRTSGHEWSALGSAAIELLSKWSARLTADKLLSHP